MAMTLKENFYELLSEELLATNQDVGNRRWPRISGHFSAKIKGVDASGEKFETDAVVDNLSARGFYLRLDREVEIGNKLCVIVQVFKAKLDLRGAVLRVEPQADGRFGLAVAITYHRFLGSVPFKHETTDCDLR